LSPSEVCVPPVRKLTDAVEIGTYCIQRRGQFSTRPFSIPNQNPAALSRSPLSSRPLSRSSRGKGSCRWSELSAIRIRIFA
jgi:hypothetical protein